MPSEPSPGSTGPIPPPPPVIPDYELVRKIGRGSYGDVWIALGLTGIYRAVKVVWRDRFTDAEPFEREFKGLKGFAAVSLTEARQMALLHVGRNDRAGFFYYVMELADDYEHGRDIDPDTYVPFTLKELRARRGRVSTEETISIGIELSRGLSGLHQRGLIHRDIKPSNVIMVGGSPKLADIGLVIEVSEARTYVGTEGFVPPEGPGTAGADIYGLGKLLYELGTGMDRNDYPRLPPSLGEWPDRKQVLELNEVLFKACDSDTTKRYVSAQALLDDLFLLQAGKSLRRLRSVERGMRRAVQWVAVLAVIAGLGLVGAVIERRMAARETALRETAEGERDALSREMRYQGAISKAQRALEQRDPGTARRILETVIPAKGEIDCRDLEWRLLWHQSEGDPGVVYRGLEASIFSFCFSEDQKTLLAGTTDNHVGLWDVESGRLKRVLSGAHRVAGLSADGEWVFGMDPRYQPAKWNLKTGQVLAANGTDVHRPRDMLDDHRLLDLVGPLEYTPEVWDYDAQRRERFLAFKDTVRQPRLPMGCLSEDRQAFVATWDYGSPVTEAVKIAVYHLDTLTTSVSPLIADEAIVLPALSPDHKEVAGIFDKSDRITLLDSETFHTKWTVQGGTSHAGTLSFSPDGKYLAGGDADDRVWVRSEADGRLVAEYRGQSGGIRQVAWTRTPQRLFSAAGDGTIRRWTDSSRQPVRQFDHYWNSIGNPFPILTPTGDWFAAPVDGTKSEAVQLKGGSARVVVPVRFPLEIRNHGQTLVGVTRDGTLSEWSLDKPDKPLWSESVFGKPTETIEAHASPDGHVVLASSLHNGAVLWDVPRHKSLMRTPEDIEAPVFSADSRFAAAVSVTTFWVYLWRLDTLAQSKVLRGQAEVPNCLALSPDNRQIAVASSLADVTILDTTTFSVIAVLHEAGSHTTTLLYTPDGQRLLLGNSGGNAHIYNTRTWEEEAVFALADAASPGNDSTLERLVMSADGSTLMAYRGDGHLHIWDCRPPELSER